MDTEVDDTVGTALDSAFPDRAVEGVDPTGPSWNEGNDTVRVAFADGGAAYLKVALDGDGSRVARERAVIGYVGATGAVPVPDVLAADADATVPYLATAPVGDRPYHRAWADADADGRVDLTRAVGRALAAVHADRFGAHGRVRGGGAAGLDIDRGSWADVLLDRIDVIRDLAPSDRLAGHFDAVADAVEANRGLLNRAPASLVHGDPAGPNAFLADGGVGLLDWEIAHVGDPARELVRARRQLLGDVREGADERLVAALHDGYRDRAGSLPAGFVERRPVYEAVTFLGVSGFVERYAEFRDDSLDEFVAWADAEMDRRLARVA